MLTEPTDLDRAGLRHVLQRFWELPVDELEYLPVGFGSHHWRAVGSGGREWFVTADDLLAGHLAPDADGTFAALERAYRTAAALRDGAGLEFVVAPLAARDGAVVRRLGDRYAVTVFPYLRGRASSFGAYETAEERRAMATVVGRVHAATPRIPADLPRSDDLAVPARASLFEALDELDAPWRAGPYADPTRRLLAEHVDAVRRRFREYDELVAEVRESSAPWVITHGEPHRANVVLAADGVRFLVDWDTTLLAPRERDLRMVLDDDLTGWDEYVAVAGPADLDRRALRLYGLGWELAEICLFVDGFRRPHEDTAEGAVAWRELTGYLGSEPES